MKLTTKSEKTNSKFIFYSLSIIVLSVFLGNFIKKSDHSQASLIASTKKKVVEVERPAVPDIRYGFDINTFKEAYTEPIRSNQFLSDILIEQQVDWTTIDKIAKKSKDIFNVNKLRAGKPYTILNKDCNTPADYFIYEPDVYSYVIFDLKNELDIKLVEKDIQTAVKTASGTIESSLWNAMVDNNLNIELIDKLENVLAWSIDFYHIQKGDEFKVIYEEKSIDGKVVAIGHIDAAYYKNLENEYHAIYYENGEYKGYYDLEGRPMKKAFLKSPVKYSRISSSYNKRRFHPILKRVKAHLGTDYAAPYGTPIYAVADGVVTKAAYTRGNGKYVKIKHDKVYQTQYLHMQKHAKGIRPGIHVKQGQVIGYVGSTGLATGPHVCFRFWKHGQQVNHLRLTLPSAKPLPESILPDYLDFKESLAQKLDAIPIFIKNDDLLCEN